MFERLQLGRLYRRDLISKFEKETGIKVNYELYDTNESMLAKLETGGTYYDLIFPSDYVIEMIAKGMLAKIDLSNIQIINISKAGLKP